MKRLFAPFCAVAAVLLAFQASSAERLSPDERWAKTFDRPQTLASLKQPAVLFLYIEHAYLIRRGWERETNQPKKHHSTRIRRRLKELSGLDCMVVHASEVANGRDLDQPQIKSIIISGRNTTEVNTDAQDERFYELIRNTKLPVLGFCGGCQLIGKAYGMKVVHLRQLRPGEKDPAPSYHAGFFKEMGFLTVHVRTPDALFARLPRDPHFKQAHAFQLPEVPPGFDLLASSPDCRVEAIKHRDRLVYGVQFHPEAFDDDHPHGRVLLENFFQIALKK